MEDIRPFDVDSQLSTGSVDQMTLVPNVEDKLRKEVRESLIEYAGTEALLWVEDPQLLCDKLDQGYAQAEAAYVAFDGMVKPLEPHALYSSGAAMSHLLQQRPYLTEASTASSAQTPWQSLPQPAFGKKFELLLDHLQAHHRAGRELWILCSLPQQQKRLASILHDLNPSEELPIHWLDAACMKAGKIRRRSASSIRTTRSLNATSASASATAWTRPKPSP